MAAGEINSKTPETEHLLEREVLTKELRLIIYPRSINIETRPTDSNGNSDEDLITIEQQLFQESGNFSVEDSLNADLFVIEFIEIKDDASHSTQKKLNAFVKNAILKHSVRENKLIIKIFILTYSGINLATNYLILNTFNALQSRFSKTIDFAKSTIEFCQITAQNSRTNLTKSSKVNEGRNTESSINNMDAKIAALLSHYVYFYLDWMEASHFKEYVFWGNNGDNYTPEIEEAKLNQTKTKKQKSIGDKIKDFFCHTGVNIPISEIAFSACKNIISYITGGDRRVRIRVINRLIEIVKIVDKQRIGNKDENEKTNYKDPFEIISDIIQDCSENGRPIEFYDLYDRFGYWTYIESDCNGLTEEAKRWHVLHPSVIAKRKIKDYTANQLITFQKEEYTHTEENAKTEIEKARLICYNTVLLHGMSQLSGYGGALFARIEETGQDVITANKFMYVNKGTDANSFNDWAFVDVLQALTGFSLQHVHAVKNAITIHKLCKKYNENVDLIFAGHSLGGGLASSCAVATPNRHAITFNAAGLNFLGSCWTRLAGAMSNFSYECLRPLAIAERVHPIRIQGEAIDLIMIGAKSLTANLNERAYGRTALVFTSVALNPASKHGINNFLFNNILKNCEIIKSGIAKENKGAGLRSSLLGLEKLIEIKAQTGGIEVKQPQDIKLNGMKSNAIVRKGSFVFKSNGKINFEELAKLLDSDKELHELLY